MDVSSVAISAAKAYRSAFTKLVQLNKADPAPNPIEVFLLHSRPPIKERLAIAGW